MHSVTSWCERAESAAYKFDHAVLLKHGGL
jgi:hypothetical protein